MKFTLSAGSFEKLLARLDPDATEAGRKYEVLRLKIEKFLHWQGCRESHAENLADTTLDRIASKIDGGEVIENINAYAVTVARFVWFEFSRKNKEDATDDFSGNTEAVDGESHDESDERIGCLRKCLVHLDLTDDDRKMIVEYYDVEAGEKLKQTRRKLAESLGVEQNALRVRAFRLRARLEDCITKCVTPVIKTHEIVTNKQEAERR